MKKSKIGLLPLQGVSFMSDTQGVALGYIQVALYSQSVVTVGSGRTFSSGLMYMVFSILTSKVRCENKSILGRADVVIETKKDVFVLELKVDDTVEKALNQIEDKSYAIQWSADGRRVTKCGVRIDSEHRNITHWRLTDVKGETIEEKIFE